MIENFDVTKTDGRIRLRCYRVHKLADRHVSTTDTTEYSVTLNEFINWRAVLVVGDCTRHNLHDRAHNSFKLIVLWPATRGDVFYKISSGRCGNATRAGFISWHYAYARLRHCVLFKYTRDMIFSVSSTKSFSRIRIQENGTENMGISYTEEIVRAE